MNPLTIPDLSLPECLALVERQFDPRGIAARRIDAAAVEEYYRQSDRGYRLFHSAEGALHLALNYDGQFEFDGYAGQAELVRRQLDAASARRVLEAGCGNGYNSLHLARLLPACQFVGVDLTEKHIDHARRAARKLANAEFVVGNYERLPYDDGSFDAVFAVESLCQTPNLSAALAEIARVLRLGGRLVNVDCFRNRPLEEFDADLQLAATLVEKTTAVDAFQVVGDWVERAEGLGYRRVEVQDLSDAVAHNLERLYGLARRFFNMSTGLWAMKQAFGPLMLENAICGLLMPFTVGGGVHGYYAVVLEREGGTGTSS